MTLKERMDSVMARMTSKLPELLNAPPVSTARVLMGVLAATAHEVAQSIPLIATAAHPATATGQHLDGLAGVWGITRKDGETDSQLRNRLILQIRAPVQAGTLSDWRRWALALDGITRAFVSESENRVAICVVNDDADTIQLTAEQLTTVREALEPLRPAGCELHICTPVLQSIEIRIASITPDSETIRQTLRENITAAVRENHEPGGVLSPGIIYQAATATGLSEINVVTPTANNFANDAHIYEPIINYD